MYHSKYLKTWQRNVILGLLAPLFLISILTFYTWFTHDPFTSELTVLTQTTLFTVISCTASFIGILGLLWGRKNILFSSAILISILGILSLLDHFDFLRFTVLNEQVNFTKTYFITSYVLTACTLLALAVVFFVFSSHKLRLGKLTFVSFVLWGIFSASESSFFNFFLYAGPKAAIDTGMVFIISLALLNIVAILGFYTLVHAWRLYRKDFPFWLLISLSFIGFSTLFSIYKISYKQDDFAFKRDSSEAAETFETAFSVYIENQTEFLNDVLSLITLFPENHRSVIDILTSSNLEQHFANRLMLFSISPESSTISRGIPLSTTTENLVSFVNKIPPLQKYTIFRDAQNIYLLIKHTKPSAKSWAALFIDLPSLIEILSKQALTDMSNLQITWNETVIAQLDPSDNQFRNSLGSERVITFTTPELHLHIWPKKNEYYLYRSPLPQAVFIFGVFLIIVVSLIFYYAETARIRGEQYRLLEAKKTSFFANISHEIRTQLQGVLGATSVLKLTELNEKQQKMVGIISLSGKTLKCLLDDILDLTRLEMGTLLLHNSVVKLEPFFEKVADMNRLFAEEEGLTLSLIFGKELPDQIVIDDERLTQVISNLLINAIKFTEQGSVTLSVSLDKSDPKMLAIKVIDTGIGIEPEAIDKLFTKFYQVDRARGMHHGTGLGLSICKILVYKMHGIIQVKSAPGKGSTFQVNIPITTPSKESQTR